MLSFLHRIGPGFVILLAGAAFFISFLLQLLVTIGLPNIRSIYFLGFTLADLGQQTRIGLWTICTDQFYSSFYMSDNGETCQNKSLGYEDSQYGTIADYLLIHSLSRGLVIQPISTAFAGIAIFSSALHLFTNIIVWPFVGALAGIFAILAFVFEIVLFSVARVRLNSNAASNLGSGVQSVNFGPGIWLQLAAMVVVIFAVAAQWTAYTRRKLRRTHAVGKLGKHDRDGASIRSYRASVSSGATATRPTSSSRYSDGGNAKTQATSSPTSENIPLRTMAAPIATAAGTTTTARAAEKSYAGRRKRVPAVPEADAEAADAGEAEKAKAVTRGPRRSSVSENDVFEDATDVGVVDDRVDDRDDRDDTVQHILGASRRGRRTSTSSSSNDPPDHREPLTEMHDTIVSPRRGRRAARYSARMADD